MLLSWQFVKSKEFNWLCCMMSKLSGSDEIPSNLRIIQKRTSKWNLCWLGVEECISQQSYLVQIQIGNAPAGEKSPNCSKRQKKTPFLVDLWWRFQDYVTISGNPISNYFFAWGLIDKQAWDIAFQSSAGYSVFLGKSWKVRYIEHTIPYI